MRFLTADEESKEGKLKEIEKVVRVEKKLTLKQATVGSSLHRAHACMRWLTFASLQAEVWKAFEPVLGKITKLERSRLRHFATFGKVSLLLILPSAWLTLAVCHSCRLLATLTWAKRTRPWTSSCSATARPCSSST